MLLVAIEWCRPQDKNDEAKKLYERSLAIRTKDLGEDDPIVAESLYNLAMLYRRLAQENYSEAHRHMERSFDIRVKKLPSDHPDTKKSKAMLDEIKQLRQKPSA